MYNSSYQKNQGAWLTLKLSPSGDKQITIILDSPAKESLKEEMGDHSRRRVLCLAKVYLGRGPRPW